MRTLILGLAILVVFPGKVQSQSEFVPTVELTIGKETPLFSPAENQPELKIYNFSGGFELTNPSSRLIFKSGISRDNLWGYNVSIKGGHDYKVGPVYWGGGGLLFLDKRTEKIFSSSPPPSFEFNGETEKKFLLLNSDAGLGNYDTNYFRISLIVGVGQIVKTNRLYVAGRLTDDSHGFPREDLLPIGGFGFEGSLRFWKDVRLNGNFNRLMTFDIYPKYINTEKLLPSKNSTVEISLRIFKTKYLEFGAVGSWAEHPYGPVISQKTAGIRIGLFPLKF